MKEGRKQLEHEVNHSAALVSRSRMSGAFPPTPECVHGMDRENFNFL